MELNGAKQDDPAFISAVYPELVKAIPSKCKKTFVEPGIFCFFLLGTTNATKLLIGMPSVSCGIFITHNYYI